MMNVAERQRQEIKEQLKIKKHAETDAPKFGDVPPKEKKAKKPKPEKETPPIPVCPPAGKVPVYFVSETSSYYARNAVGEYQRYNDGLLNLLLRSNGFNDQIRHLSTLTYLEAEKLRITQEASVHYAGPLGGFAPGLFEMNGNRVLVTRGAKHVVPAKGEWPLFKDFLQQLLGKEAKYFLAWIQSALLSLEAGYPWSPGQMLCIAGSPNSGKSMLQSLITPMLGGRASNPYEYMTKGDKYNKEVMGAEHALIGDEDHKYDARSRRRFGNAIKKLIVNPEQRLRAMQQDGLTVEPFLRLSLTVNNNKQALSVMPELDGDVADKLMLLLAKPVEFPFPSPRFPTKHVYYAALKAELPAFIYHLMRWKMPETMADKRYGVVSYKNAELLEQMCSISSEWKLWNLIEMYIFADRTCLFWEGTAAELEREIRDRTKGENIGSLFKYSGACGQYLVTLMSQLPGQIEQVELRSNRHAYLIHRPDTAA